MNETEKKSGAVAGSAPVVFWESKVATSLGLSRDRVRALREAHLTADEWTTRGNAIVLTEAGLEKISFYAAQGEGAVPSPSGEQAQAVAQAGGVALSDCGAPPEVVKVVVKKVCPNPRMMLARREGADEAAESLLVRVKDNSLFMVGMLIEVIDCGNGVWQFRGRMPRSRGRF